MTRPNRQTVSMAAAASLCLLGWACGGESSADGPAHARLINERGVEVAQARFTETEAGVRMELAVENLPPGSYRAQIHETGICEAPDFLSAGAPYPPPQELAMVESASPALHRSVAQFQVTDGRAEVEAVAPVVTLRPGDNSLFHPGGTALIIDDLSPAGTFEGRVACGLITRASETIVEDLPAGELESARQPNQPGTPGKQHRRPASEP